MKKYVKIFGLLFVFVGLLSVLSAGFFLGSRILKYSTLQIEDSLFTQSSKIEIFDSENNQIFDDTQIASNYEKLSNMPPYVYQAFVSIEDKDFYKHKGINPKRILKATFTNLKTRSFNQGASTITQQLIKNTHLSSEKTIDRKVKEIILSFRLEKQMTKEDILTNYLNVIYFGNNCYGISSASEYYFSKPCFDLTLEEGALLAGMIKSPNIYSPIKHEERAKQRRNIVLEQMHKDQKISQKQLFDAKNKPLNLNLNTQNENPLNSYSQAVIDEACKILRLSIKQIALSNLKIYTYQDEKSQQKLEESLSSVDFESNDFAGIVLDNKLCGVTAFSGSSAYKILDAKRQPGSCLKPLLVYGPALNEDIISPQTQILDEKIKVCEYAPENVNNSYIGYVSAKEALSKSINIPAIKTLSYVGIEKAKEYPSSLGIEFDEKDNSLALALGGMTYGVDLKTLATSYACIANLGKYSPSKFISHITNQKGEIIYQHKPFFNQVFREDSSYLLTDMLCQASKTGTAKKLADLNMNIASKTGTVGKKNSKENLDAWNISYNQNKTVGVWTGNLTNQPITTAGGNQPTQVVKNFFKTEVDAEFERPNSIVEREIDTITLEKDHIVTLANSSTPQRFKMNAVFSSFNLPKESHLFTSLPKENFEIKKIDGKQNLCFTAKSYLIYNIYTKENKFISSICQSEEKHIIPLEKGEFIFEYCYTGHNEKVIEKINID